MIYQSDTLSVRYLEDGLAELNFNAQGHVNKLDIATLENLKEALKILTKKSDISALLLTTAKPAFIVGADINEFLTLFAKPEKELSKWLAYANSIFNTLEDLPFPTVSMISGYALGGGCECVLATDFRIADTTARIGLPETKLGIMPGFGGTVRLPRLLGADSAMEIIIKGKELKANAALKIGLIDAISEPEHLRGSALSMANQAASGKLNWQTRRMQKKSPLQLNNVEAAMCFNTAKAMVSQIAGPHYPAPLTAVIAIEQASKSERDEALEIENKYFVQLAKNNVTPALVGIFLNEQFVKAKTKLAIKNAKETEHAAVLGAGIMGGGVAYQCARKGVPILMKDINQGSLDAGMKEATTLLNKQLINGRINALQMSEVLNSIVPTLHYAGIEKADIIVEAVIENPKIKAEVLSETEEYLNKDAILTSNTSTIPINLLAKSLKRKENFCGMHFFNPVHRMPLVEIIRGEHSSDETISRVLAFACKMGKTPIVVNDCPGFFVNRVLFPYFAGFSLLLRDGANYIKIDEVMEKMFGWPMGPAYLLDVVGIDTAHHAHIVMAEGFPERMAKIEQDGIDIMFENKRFGQKVGVGFYKYTINKKGKLKKEIDMESATLLAPLSGSKQDFTDEEIIQRMMVPMINEVVLCLEENIIATPQEADIALVYGIGFPPFRGGVFRYLQTIGLENYVKMADKLSALGPAYFVPKSLREKAAKGEVYFDD